MKPIKALFVLTTGLLAGAYLLNLGVGVVEILPDNIPIIGNLDEAGATVLLLHCLAYFGLDLSGRSARRDANSTQEWNQRGE